MGARNCGETIVEGLREVVETLAPRARPSRESANGRQHVVDAMLELVPEYPFMLRALRQSGLGIHTLDSRGQQVGVSSGENRRRPVQNCEVGVSRLPRCRTACLHRE